MQLHELRPTIKRKSRKRIGRGGKRGTYSGRGMKGQKSRAGANMEPIVRELIKRYPKLRGYRRKALHETRVVNVGALEQRFEEHDIVTPFLLVQKRIVRRKKGRIPSVKILGSGEIQKALIVQHCEVSETAQKKIEKAGGKVS